MIESVTFHIQLETFFSLHGRLYSSNTGGELAVDLPNEYKSKLKNALEDDEEEFALISFRLTNLGVYIDTFQTSVNSPNYRLLSTEFEINAAKQLEALILHKLLSHLLSKNVIAPETQVNLKVVPFLSCDFERYNNLKLKYEIISTQNLLEKLKKFPAIFSSVNTKLKHINDDEEKHKLLILSFCKLEFVIELVNYYKKFGFQTSFDIEKYNFEVPMQSTVNTIMKQCLSIT